MISLSSAEMAPSSKILKTNFADGIYEAWRCIYTIDLMELETTVLNEYVPSSMPISSIVSMQSAVKPGAKDIYTASPDRSKACQYAVSVRL